jgi:hypothetical protein
MRSQNELADVQGLLVQAAERLREISLIAEDVEGCAWRIEFNQGEGLVMEWCADDGRLVLSADLGFPPPDGEMEALRMALSYNAQWRDIGDLRIARNGDAGELILVGELGPEESSPDAFNAALKHFEALRAWWSEAIANCGEQQPSSAAPPNSLPMTRI